jgi:hypothetical protein
LDFLSHAYAQESYKKLTGWDCPAQGGPPKKKLSRVQKEIDLQVRLEISKLLGHGRAAITDVYCG